MSFNLYKEYILWNLKEYERAMNTFPGKTTNVGSVPEPSYLPSEATHYLYAETTVGDILELGEDLVLDKMSREELIKECSDLQLDYQDLVDFNENLQDDVSELELDILQLEAENAQLRYDLALSQRVNEL